ncbi:MAG: C40 family peptidase [Flavitalea sp.]
MKTGISLVPVSPIRAEPSHRSEMVSQLLFGEACDILETKEDWFRISVIHDGYKGWITSNHIHLVEQLNLDTAYEFASGYINAVLINNIPMFIPMGSILHHIHSIKDPYMVYQGSKTGILEPDGNLMIETAKKFLNTAYLWGGRSVFGIDCSGFCQMVYRFFGLSILRDAWQQAVAGELVGFLQEGRAGDLAFFDNAEGKIIHVGMLIDSETIIHASGKVRIDKIDNAGIVNSETGLRTHKLRVIKRFF